MSETTGFRLAGGADKRSQTNEVRFYSGQQKEGNLRSENPSAQPSNGNDDSWKKTIAIPGVYTGTLDPQPGMYPPWLGCGPYHVGCYPGHPPVPSCIPGIGASTGKAPQCFSTDMEPDNAVVADPSSRILTSTEGSKYESLTNSATKHHNIRQKTSRDTIKSRKTHQNTNSRNKPGGIGWVASLTDTNNPQNLGAHTTSLPVDPAKNAGPGPGAGAACGCARRHGPCPAHCLQPKPLDGDDDEKKRRERHRRRIAVRRPSCTMPLVLPYRRKRARRALACPLKGAGGSERSLKKPEDAKEAEVAKDCDSSSQANKREVYIQDTKQKRSAEPPSHPSPDSQLPTVDDWGIPYITPFHVAPGARVHGHSDAPMKVESSPSGFTARSLKRCPESNLTVSCGPTGPTTSGQTVAVRLAPQTPRFVDTEERRDHPHPRPQSRRRQADTCLAACGNCPILPDGCGPAASRAAKNSKTPQGRGPCYPKPPPPSLPPPLPCGQQPTDSDFAAAACTKDLEAGQVPPCMQPMTMICKMTPVTKTLMCYERKPRPCTEDPQLCKGGAGSCWGKQPAKEPSREIGFKRKQIWPPPIRGDSDPSSLSHGAEGEYSRFRGRKPKDTGCRAHQPNYDCPTISHCLAQANAQ